MRADLVEEADDVSRIIFAVRVHDDDGIAGHSFVNEREAHRKRALMAEVPAEGQYTDFPDGAWRVADQVGRRFAHRAVIHEHHTGTHAVRSELAIQMRQQEANGFPVVVHRRDDNEIRELHRAHEYLGVTGHVWVAHACNVGTLEAQLAQRVNSA